MCGEETLTRETQSGGLGLLSVSVAPSISWTPTVCPGCWPCQSLSRSSRRARFPHACSHAAIAAALTERTTATILSRPRPPTGRAQLAPRYLPRPLLRLGRRRVGDGRRRLLARMLLLCSWLRLLRSCLSPARGTACSVSERGLAKNGRASSRAYCERETFFAMCAALTADLRSPLLLSWCGPGRAFCPPGHQAHAARAPPQTTEAHSYSHPAFHWVARLFECSVRA